MLAAQIVDRRMGLAVIGHIPALLLIVFCESARADCEAIARIYNEVWIGAEQRQVPGEPSIQGGPIPIDPMSFAYFLKSEHDVRYLSDPELQEKVANSLLIDDIDFTRYDVVYLAGGWGAAYDLGFSKVLGHKITEAYAAGKVVGGVCHGPLGLLMARDESGRPLVEGRRLTAVTDKQVEELGISMTPQHPERELRAAGAVFKSATAFRDLLANHVVADGRLVTGQNQNAGAEVANKMMQVAAGTRR